MSLMQKIIVYGIAAVAIGFAVMLAMEDFEKNRATPQMPVPIESQDKQG